MGVRTGIALTAVLAAACGPRPEASSAPPSVRNERIVSASGLAPAAAEPRNPFGDSTSVTEGARLFSVMNCDGCHSGGAVGGVGPSLVDGRWRYGGSDGEVFHSIYYGRPRGMPAYGGVLPPAAIWKIMTYLRSQPRPSDLPTQSWP